MATKTKKFTDKELVKMDISTYYHTINAFVSPIDRGSPWKPYSNQIRIYNIVDFGYDIASKLIKPPLPPKYLTIVGPRQSFGKSEGIASLCGSLMMRFDDCTIGVMNNKQANAEILVKRITKYIRNAKYKDSARHKIISKKLDVIELANGSGCWAYGQSDNIRGRSFTYLIIDEAAQFPDELLREGAFPVTRVKGAWEHRKTPDTIMLSTPAGAHGIFHEYYKKGMDMRMLGCRECFTIFKQNEFRHVTRWPHRTLPLDIGVCPKCGKENWEYVSGEFAVYHIDPYDHPTKTAEEIDREVRNLGDTPGARQEILGEFMSAGTKVFRETWVNACTDLKLRNVINPSSHLKYVMSVDFGKMHDNTVFAFGHHDNLRGKDIMDYMKIIPSKGGLEYHDIRYELLTNLVRFNPVWLVPDSTALGDPVVEDMEYDLKCIKREGLDIKFKLNGVIMTRRIERVPNLRTKIFNNKETRDKKLGKKVRLGFKFDYDSKFQLIEYAVEQTARERIKIPPKYEGPDMEAFYEELLNFDYEYSSNNRIIYGTQSGHDDTVIAYALLLWGLRRKSRGKITMHVEGEDNFVLR